MIKELKGEQAEGKRVRLVVGMVGVLAIAMFAYSHWPVNKPYHPLLGAILELVAAIGLLGVANYFLWLRQARPLPESSRLILAGSALVIFGHLLFITEEIPALDRFFLLGADFPHHGFWQNMVMSAGYIVFLIGGLSAFQDLVAAERRHQTTLQRQQLLQQQLHQADKLASIGQLVSGVAHELNNPLTGVLGYSELLAADPELSGKQRDMVQTILQLADRSRAIVDDLLAFARTKEPETSTVDLVALLNDTIRLREYETKTSSIKIKTDFLPTTLTTVADPRQLQQVFLNILNNACDALRESEGGLVRIAARRQDDHLRITFEDTGPGVPPEIRERIFDPFFTTKPLGSGTGLGLSVSHGIIQRHGGRLYFDPSYTTGARFVVELPEGGALPARQTGRPAPDGNLDGEGRRVLVVDDEPALVEMMQRMLGDAGYQVDTATSGQAAVGKICNGGYDLVIADIRMPGAIDGRRLYQIIKHIRPGMEKRVVFSTGDTVSQDTRTFLKETGNPFISKPFRLNDLLQFVKQNIRP